MAQKVLVALIIISAQDRTVKAVEIALSLGPGDSFRVPSPGLAQMVPSVPGGTASLISPARSSSLTFQLARCLSLAFRFV